MNKIRKAVNGMNEKLSKAMVILKKKQIEALEIRLDR